MRLIIWAVIAAIGVGLISRNWVGNHSIKGVFGLDAGMPIEEVQTAGMVGDAYILRSVPHPIDGFDRYMVRNSGRGICQVTAVGSFEIDYAGGGRDALKVWDILAGRYGRPHMAGDDDKIEDIPVFHPNADRDEGPQDTVHSWSFKEGRADNILRLTLIYRREASSDQEPYREQYQVRLTEDFGGSCT